MRFTDARKRIRRRRGRALSQNNHRAEDRRHQRQDGQRFTAFMRSLVEISEAEVQAVPGSPMKSFSRKFELEPALGLDGAEAAALFDRFVEKRCASSGMKRRSLSFAAKLIIGCLV